MRTLRICVLVLFVIVTLVFGVFFVRDTLRRDNTVPQISVRGDVLEISVKDEEAQLLSGVTAFDEKDGDLTDHVVIESVSGFLTPGECNVRYAVCDGNNHVSHAERRIRYTDYTAPKFYLNRSLCFSTVDDVNLISCVGAKDVIDGDISDSIIITSSNFDSGEAGEYYFQCEVANSKGDMIVQKFPVYVDARGYSAPTIQLSKYMTYMKVGEKLDFRDLVTKVTDQYGEVLGNVRLSYDSGLNTNKPGIYTIHYYAQTLSEDGTVSDDVPRGHTVHIVVVEE